MEKGGLKAPHGVTTHTADDGSSFWAQRQTVSGWWLARGLTLDELGFIDVWYYSGQDAPTSGPSRGRKNQSVTDGALIPVADHHIASPSVRLFVAALKPSCRSHLL